MLGGGHRLSIAEMTARYGKDVAFNLLKEAHLDSADFVRKVMIEEAIDCDYEQVGRFRGLWHTHEYETAARDLEQLQKLLPIEASLLSRTQQHQAVASDLYRGGVVYHQHAAINPAKWVLGCTALQQIMVLSSRATQLFSACKNQRVAVWSRPQEVWSKPTKYCLQPMDTHPPNGRIAPAGVSGSFLYYQH